MDSRPVVLPARIISGLTSRLMAREAGLVHVLAVHVSRHVLQRVRVHNKRLYRVLLARAVREVAILARPPHAGLAMPRRPEPGQVGRRRAVMAGEAEVLVGSRLQPVL